MINKGGSVKTETVKSLKVSDLYKKCKFRKPDDFAKRHTWKYKNKWVSVYAKNKGRANSENKYDLPPPIDNDLYFIFDNYTTIYTWDLEGDLGSPSVAGYHDDQGYNGADNADGLTTISGGDATTGGTTTTTTGGGGHAISYTMTYDS